MSSLLQLDPKFIINIDEFISINSLTSILATDPNKVLFILSSACIAYFSNSDSSFLSQLSSLSLSTTKTSKKDDRYHPNVIPYYLEMYGDILTESEVRIFFEIISNTDSFIELLSSLASHESASDSFLFPHFLSKRDEERIHPEIFRRILYFTIFTNRISFCEDIRLRDPKKICVFTVKNDLEKERSFYNIPGESKFLFHGTHSKNMYSIARNGILSMSGTNFQSNGAAYGPGIYLSDSLSFASNYSNFDTSQKSLIILCYQVKNINKKNNNIFVQQDSETCLRAILWIRNFESDKMPILEGRILYVLEANRKHYVPISTETIGGYVERIPSQSNYLRVKDPAKEPRIKPNTRSVKRVTKEIAELFSLVEDMNNDIVRVNYVIPDDSTTPLLIEMKIPQDTSLYTQGEVLGVSTVVFAIYIHSDYPFEKPGFRIVRPCFVRGGGHITNGGSICASLLYGESWTPQLKIHGVLTTIMSLIADDQMEKPAVIDRTRLNVEYNYNDYLESYSNAGVSHGWS